MPFKPYELTGEHVVQLHSGDEFFTRTSLTGLAKKCLLEIARPVSTVYGHTVYRAQKNMILRIRGLRKHSRMHYEFQSVSFLRVARMEKHNMFRNMHNNISRDDITLTAALSKISPHTRYDVAESEMLAYDDERIFEDNGTFFIIRENNIMSLLRNYPFTFVYDKKFAERDRVRLLLLSLSEYLYISTSVRGDTIIQKLPSLQWIERKDMNQGFAVKNPYFEIQADYVLLHPDHLLPHKISTDFILLEITHKNVRPEVEAQRKKACL